MHADGYAGFEDLYRSGDILEVVCIAQLYAVEKEARGSPPDKRIELRQAKAKLVFDDLDAWLHTQLPSISGKSPLAGAIRYALIETAKLNDIDPQAWLADTLARIPDYKINRVDDLLPWKTVS